MIKRKITDGVVTVFGYIPEGVKLVVENYSNIRMFSLFNAVQTPLARLNITLYNPDGSEWQPEEGQPVSVTLDAAGLGLKDGHGYIISHIHEDETTGETATKFAASPSNGKMTFNLTGFSYVLVFEGTQTFSLPNIDVFYTTSSGVDSTNDHLQFLGIYYDTSGNTHFLVATVQPPDKDLNKIVNVTVDGITFQREDITLKTYTSDFTTVKFKAEDDNNILQTVKINNGNVAQGFVDFNVGNIKLGEKFSFAVNKEENGNGWKIGGNAAIHLEYDLTKDVAKGTSADADFTDSVIVERGDWVIYKVTVNNIGTMMLSGMTVTDIIPEEAFVPGSIMMGIGDAAGNVANWETFDSVLFADYNSPGQFSRDLYIRAQVRPDLDIDIETKYVNSAKIEGVNMPSVQDIATITVKPPTLGTLTVSKAVTSENPLDLPDPNEKFTFTVVGANNFSDSFTLTNGESKSFEKFPLGDYTVTETNAEGYTTTVNGIKTNVYTDTMIEGAAPVVAFENKFSVRSTTLAITKRVEKDYANDDLPTDDDFNFKVSISGEGVPSGFSYTMSDGTYGTFNSDNIITLKANQTVVIHGIPVGADYTVTEDLDNRSNDYEFVSVSGGTIGLDLGTAGKLGSNGAVIVFTNRYKKHLADLNVSKSGAQSIDENQSFVFRVVGNGIDMKVIIHGNGSVTIKDLPCGSYTVTEETAWSWRYSPDRTTKAVQLPSDGASVGFVNTRSLINWLNGCAWCDNRWINASSEKSGT